MTKAERFRQLTAADSVRGDLRRRSVRAAAFTWAAGASDFALRIGSTAILARLILPEHFGLVMMVTAITAVADQFRDLGLSTATVQKETITCEEVTNLFWVNVAAGTLIAAVVCASAPLVAAFYRDPRLTAITCAMAANFFLGGLMVQHQALLSRKLKLGYTAGVRMSSSVLSTVLAIVLAWKGYGYWALVWREVARYALITAGMWFCLPWVPGRPDFKTDIRALLHFGAHMSAANIIGVACGGVDRLLLGRFWGPTPVAMYRQAYSLMVLPIDQLVSPVYQVAQPGMAMVQSDPERFRRFYHKVAAVVSMWTMPLSVFVAVYSTEVTRILLGRKWADAAPLLMIVSLGAFIKQPVGSAMQIAITRGKSRIYLNLVVLQSVAFVAFAGLGVPWAAKGMAAADVAKNYLMAVPILVSCFRGSPVSMRAYFAAIGRPIAASLIMGAALVGLRLALPALSAIPALAAGCAVGGAVLLAAWMVLPGGRAELSGLIEDVRTAMQRKSGGIPAVAPAAAK